MLKMKWVRIAAWTALVSFSSFELGYAQGVPVSELLGSSPQPEQKINEAISSTAKTSDVLSSANALDFLENSTPLSRPESEPPVEEPAKTPKETSVQSDQKNTVIEARPERASFADAVDELRPEYASAVIVNDLSVEDLAALSRLDFETAIVVLDGEIVLFTTGNKHDIGYTEPVRKLMQQASFISHVHSESGDEGPSSFDLIEAVDAPKSEFVITSSSAYEYNRQGMIHGGKADSQQEFIQKLKAAVSASRPSDTEGSPRQRLNEFIAGMDAYNEAQDQDRLTFRRGDTVSEALNYDASGNVIQRQRTTYNDSGRITAYELIGYAQNIRTTRNYYEYDLQGRWSFTQSDRYDAAGVLSSRTQTQYVNGKTSGYSVVEYYVNGSFKSKDQTTYAADETGLPEKRVYEAYDVAGQTTQRINQLYDTAGKTKSYEDGRYTGGIQQSRNYYEYDDQNRWTVHEISQYFETGILSTDTTVTYAQGVITSYALDEYFSNSIPKSKDRTLYYSNGQGLPLKRNYEVYDAVGHVTQSLEQVYDTAGKTVSYGDTRFSNDLRTSRAYYEYDSQNRFTLTQSERYDAAGAIQSITTSQYSDGKPQTDRLQSFNSQGRLTENQLWIYGSTGRITDYYEYHYEQESSPWFYHYHYDLNGAMTRQTIEILSPLKTVQPDYLLSYRLEGVIYTEHRLLSEGVNVFQQLSALNLPVEIPVTLKTSDYRIDLLQPLPARTRQKSFQVSYRAGGVVKSKTFELLEGPNRILLSDADANGYSASLQFDIVLDTIPPRIVVTGTIPARTANSNLTIAYTADGIEKLKNYVLQEGANTVGFSEKDDLGNESVKSWNVVLDQTGPIITLVNEMPAKTRTPNMVLQYKADGVLKTKNISLVEGTNLVEIREKDDLNNETVKQWTVVLDTVAPAIVVTDSIPVKTRQSQLLIHYTSDGIAREKMFLLQEGVNALVLTEADDAGNVTVKNLSIEKDTTPPVLAVTSGVPARTRQSQLTVLYSIDGVSQSKAVALQEGANTIILSAKDDLGNEAIKTLSVVLDTTAPEIIVTNSPALRTRQSQITVQYTADSSPREKVFNLNEGANQLMLQETDDVGNQSVKILDIVKDTTPPAIVLTGDVPQRTRSAALTVAYTSDGQPRMKAFQLIEGINALSISEKDDLGNETVKSLTVTLDTTPPSIVIAEMPPARTRNAVLAVAYTSDGQPRTKTFQLAEGVNALSISEKDDLGNEAIKTLSVVLDTKAPEIIVTNTPPSRTRQSQITVQYTADGSPREKVFNLNEGANQLMLQETDDVGNQSVKILDVAKDTTPPVIVLTGDVPQRTRSAALTVAYTSDGQPRTKTFQLIEGINTLLISEKDDLGNETVKSLTVTLDTTPPSIVIAEMPPARTRNAVLAVAYTSDGQSRTKTFQLAEGANALSISEKDDLGNETVKTLSVALDTQGPVLELLTAIPEKTENSLTIQYKIDGVLREKQWDLTGLPGTREWMLTEKDDLGNESQLHGMTYFDPPDYSKTLSDGTVLDYVTRILRHEQMPSGAQVFYDTAGRIERYRSQTGESIRYIDDAVDPRLERVAANGNLEEVIRLPKTPELEESALIHMAQANGTIVFYKDGQAVEFRTADGIRVTDFIQDETGRIQDALMSYPDGHREVIREGMLLRRIEADESWRDFLPGGLSVREMTPGGMSWYAYEKQSQDSVLKTRINAPDGSFVEYDEMGMLDKVIRHMPQGTGEQTIHYVKTVGANGFVVKVEDPADASLAAKTPVEIDYSATGVVTGMKLKDASTLKFQDGHISKALDAEGHETAYEYFEQNGVFTGLQVQRGQTGLVYDQTGFLKEIQTGDGKIIREPAPVAVPQGLLTGSAELSVDPAVQLLLETTGGDQLSNFELDPDGRILNGLLTTKEGIKQTIENGILTGFQTVDGKIYGIRDGQGGREAVLKEWNLRDGTRILYGLPAGISSPTEPETISEILFPDGKRLHTIGFDVSRKLSEFTEELPDGTRKFFSRMGFAEGGGQKLQLAKLITASGTEIDYDAAGLAEKIILPGEEPQAVAYHRDDEGAIQEIIFSSGHEQRVFAADGTLKRFLKDGVTAEMTDHEITRLSTLFGEVDAPRFNADGILSGDVSLADGTQLTLQDGILTKAVKPNGTRIYYLDGRVSAVEDAVGRYDLVYQQNSAGVLLGVALRYEDEGVIKEEPLIPYLLAHPGSELSEILFPRALHNALENRSEVKSSLDSHELFFSQIVHDAERGSAYEFANEYFPEWMLQSQNGDAGLNYLESANFSGTTYPITHSMVIDMNGDGLPDRVFVDPNNAQWWIQLNNGLGFDAPRVWPGLEGPAGILDYQTASIRSYDGKSEMQLNDLADINGDGLPDRIMLGKGNSTTWYVQLNTGSGFAPAILWSESIQPVVANGLDDRAGYALESYGYNAAGQSNALSDLIDMNGDGIPDRIVRPLPAPNAPHDHWYIQYGTSTGFQEAVLWTGVDSTIQSWRADGESTALSWYEQGTSSQSSLSLVALNAWSQWTRQAICTNTRFGQNCVLPSRTLILDALNEIRKAFPFFDRFYNAYSHQSIGFDLYSETYQREMIETYTRITPRLIGDQSKLVDINGDSKPDRILLSQTGSWYVQFNNGSGFDSAILWDDNVRNLPDVAQMGIASALRVSEDFEKNNIMTDLRDVTGDGLPDRITVDHGPRQDAGFVDLYITALTWWKQGANSTGRLNLLNKIADYERHEATHTWWVEVNNGHGFEPAVAWNGIYGNSTAETAITQNEKAFLPTTYEPYLGLDYKKVSDLIDLNGDGIPDRVIYPQGEGRWLVQYGTGSGFLAVEEMKIDSIAASTESINSARYDYLHASFRSDSPIAAEQGSIKIMLGDPAQHDRYQEWTVTGLTNVWKDFYLPLDKTKGDASQVKVEFVPADGNAPVIPVYVDNLTFTVFHPPAVKDWLDSLLTSEDLLAEAYSDRTQTISSLLSSASFFSSPAFSGGVQAGDEIDWQTLLQAETQIHFDETGEADQFETLYGSVSKIEDGHVVETVLPNGSQIHFDAAAGSPQSLSQTVTQSDGSVSKMQLNYGKVRSITRPGKSPLEYSYEFDSAGREITVVRDPDSRVTERYLGEQLIQRSQANGVVTVFQYNEKGDLSGSVISYKGREYQKLTYETSSAGNRVVRAEDGSLEEYAPDGTLLFNTTPDGYRYAHTVEETQKVITTSETQTTQLPDGTSFTIAVPKVTFQPDPQGEKVFRVSLDGFHSPEGEAAHYEAGELKSLTLADGTLLSFDRFETTENLDKTTGDIKKEIRLLDATVFHPDGTVTEFKNGEPFSVTSAAGHTISLMTEGGDLINPAESAAFHKAQAEKLWNDKVLAKWNAFQVAPTLSVQMEYSMDGTLNTRRFGEGVIEIYENGRIQQTVSPDGERLIEYQYDEAGNPTRIELSGARRRLEASALKLKAEIAVEKERAVAFVAARDQVINETIEAKYTVTRDRLLAIRAQIEGQAGKVASVKVKGKAAKNAVGDAMDSIQTGLAQVDAALAQLAEKRVEALEQLSAQVREVSAKIEIESADALHHVDLENEKSRHAILMQEISPVVYHWYRKMLGRDPSQAEYDHWLNLAASDPVASVQEGTGIQQLPVPSWLVGLKAELTASSELTQRTTEVNAIKASVTETLNQYGSLSTDQKKIFAASLGISTAPLGTELVDLTASEISSILGWLNSQSMHFGQSAYIALEALLQQSGFQKTACTAGSSSEALCYSNGTKTFSRVQLATELILTDILTGTLTPFESSDLVISLYAMKRFAARQGLETNALSLDYAALKAFYTSSTSEKPKLIAHINGNHYVILTSVTDSEVTYMDPGLGAEGSNSIVTLTKEAFLAVWINSGLPGTNQGVILSPANRVITNPEGVKQPQVLSTAQTMRVRGAFFALIALAAIAIANAVVAAVVATVAAVSAIIAGLVAGIGSFLTGFGSFFGSLFAGNLFTAFNGLFGGILQGLGQIGTGLLNGLTSFGSTFMHTFTALQAGSMTATQALTGAAAGLFGNGGLFSAAAIKTAVLVGAVGAGFQGVGNLLEVAGVSPKISGTLMAGGKFMLGIGLLATGNPLGLAASLGFASSGASDFLSLHTNLSPVISQIITVGTTAIGAFAGGILNPHATGLNFFTQALPTLKMDLASAGITGLGSAIGLDPRITALISVPVRATVGSIAGNTLGLEGYRNVLGNIASQMTSGFVSVGASIGLNALGAPSILQTFVPGILGQLAISGTGSTGGGGGPSAGRSLLSKITEGIAKFGNALLTAGQQGISFSAKVIEGVGDVTKAGFAKAVDFFSGIFDRQTQEILIYAGNGSIENALNNNCSALTDGIHCAYQNINIDYLKVDNKLSYSNAGVQGSFNALNKIGDVFGGSIAFAQEAGPDGVQIVQDYEGGSLTNVKMFKGLDKLLEIKPFNTYEPLEFTNAVLTDGVLSVFGDNAVEISVRQGLLENYKALVSQEDFLGPNDVQKQEDVFVNVKRNLDGHYSGAITIENPNGDAATVRDRTAQLTDIFFGNGINNPQVPLNVSPEYANQFVQAFAAKGLNLETVPLFENSGIGWGIYQAAKEMYFTNTVTKDKIKYAIMNRIQQQSLAPGEKLKLILYSGAGQAGLDAAQELGNEQGVQFSNIVLVDAPVFINSPLANVGKVSLITGARLASNGGLPSIGIAFPFLPRPEGGIELPNIFGMLKLKTTHLDSFGHLDFIDEKNVNAVVKKIIESLDD